jgi:hypothetical protein
VVAFILLLTTPEFLLSFDITRRLVALRRKDSKWTEQFTSASKLPMSLCIRILLVAVILSSFLSFRAIALALPTNVSTQASDGVYHLPLASLGLLMSSVYASTADFWRIRSTTRVAYPEGKPSCSPWATPTRWQLSDLVDAALQRNRSMRTMRTAARQTMHTAATTSSSALRHPLTAPQPPCAERLHATLTRRFITQAGTAARSAAATPDADAHASSGGNHAQHPFASWMAAAGSTSVTISSTPRWTYTRE